MSEEEKTDAERALEAAFADAPMSLEDRDKMVDKYSDHPDHNVMTSVWESLMFLIENNQDTSWTDVTFDNIAKYVDGDGMNPNAVMVFFSETLNGMLDAARLNGEKVPGAELQLWLVERGLSDLITKYAHLAFFAGALYHQRNSALLAQLLQEQVDEEKVTTARENIERDAAGS